MVHSTVSISQSRYAVDTNDGLLSCIHNTIDATTQEGPTQVLTNDWNINTLDTIDVVGWVRMLSMEVDIQVRGDEQESRLGKIETMTLI